MAMNAQKYFPLLGILVLIAGLWFAQNSLNGFYLQILGLLGINIMLTVSLN